MALKIVSLTFDLPEPHLFLRQPSLGLDFSISTNVSTIHTSPDSWIPPPNIGEFIRGVYFKDSIFACDRTQICKQLPIGHSQWIDIANYQEPERSAMTLTIADGKILLAGGKTISTSE